MKAAKGIGCLLALLWMPQVLPAQTTVDLRGALPEETRESSGLLLRGGVLITHNDSGNEPVLYELDTVTLQVRRRVRVLGATNTDWEDMAEDAEYLYIGDIGNNLGMRRDLKVLRISKSEYDRSDAVQAEVIAYRYEDQADYTNNGNSDWDAEALVSYGDSLLLFTKEWKSGGTVAYSLPKVPGEYLARRVARYPVRGLVTGAAPASAGDGLVLLGYSAQLQPFTVFVPSTAPSFAFPEAAEKQMLDIGFGQTEGICAAPGNRYFVSSESYSNALVSLPASVFVLKPLASPADSPTPEPGGTGQDSIPGRPGQDEGGFGLRLYRAPGSPILEYDLEHPQTILARAVYDTTGRRVLFESGPGDPPGQLDISHLETSVYYLALYADDRVWSRPFLRY